MFITPSIHIHMYIYMCPYIYIYIYTSFFQHGSSLHLQFESPPTKHFQNTLPFHTFGAEKRQGGGEHVLTVNFGAGLDDRMSSLFMACKQTLVNIIGDNRIHLV